MGSSLLIINRILGHSRLTIRTLVDNRSAANRALPDHSPLAIKTIMGSLRLATNKTSVASKALTSLVDLTINRVLETRITMVVCRGMGIRVNPLSHLQTRSQILSRSVPGRFKTSSQGHRRTLASVGKEALNRIKVNHSLVKTRPRFQIMGSLVS